MIFWVWLAPDISHINLYSPPHGADRRRLAHLWWVAGAVSGPPGDPQPRSKDQELDIRLFKLGLPRTFFPRQSADWIVLTLLLVPAGLSSARDRYAAASSSRSRSSAEGPAGRPRHSDRRARPLLAEESAGRASAGPLPSSRAWVISCRPVRAVNHSAQRPSKESRNAQ